MKKAKEKILDLNFAPSEKIWTFEANELSLREMWSPGVAAEQTVTWRDVQSQNRVTHRNFIFVRLHF